MSPYLRAHEAYHKDGDPWIPWATALDFHLQHGVVTCDDEVFLMARRVPIDAPNHEHPDLFYYPHAPAACWHVWMFAGDLRRALEIAAEHGAEVATFQRRGDQLHKMSIKRCHLFHRQGSQPRASLRNGIEQEAARGTAAKQSNLFDRS